MKTWITGICLFALIGAWNCTSENIDIEKAWRAGLTLPVEVGKEYPPVPIPLKEDKGYNILVDLAHQCSFNYMWDIPDLLQGMGYRTVSSQASLHTVLDPQGVSRVRIPYDTLNHIYPFAWYPNFSYDLIITQQGSPLSPRYTPEECDALVEFVNQGGSLVITAGAPKDGNLTDWSLNTMASLFGVTFTQSALQLDASWEVTLEDSLQQPLRARRKMGKGRVAVTRGISDFLCRNAQDSLWVEETLAWLCANRPKRTDEPRLPQTMYGGGAIYPELEAGASGIVVYYAPNINADLLSCVQDEFPKITEKILNWLPSDPTDEPMYLILSAGDGGGWAVNAFKPKENGIISLSRFGLISIYAHELAHTLGGPSNSQGQKAGESPFANQGEAHAGWFQGKINALYKPELLEQPNRQCDVFFHTPEFARLDLKRYSTDEAYRSEFKKGVDWTKTWYIWQRLDDVYGPEWYPRWKNTQYTRWENQPKHILTWEETIEDMSLAVGADLFPFFISLNTSLDRPQMGTVTYQGKEVTLPAVDIPLVNPGPVRVEPLTQR